MNQLVSQRFRLPISIFVGVAVLAVAFSYLKFETSLLLAWTIGVICLLILMGIRIVTSNAEQTMRTTQRHEPSTIGTLIGTALTCGVSLVGTAWGLQTTKNMTATELHVHLGVSVIAIICSWLLLNTQFAFHYAHLYYAPTTANQESDFKKGLEFPREQVMVDYWDFMYYSFTVGMCYQTADISTISPTMRRLTLIHSIVSFWVVTVIIGSLVNIINTLIQS
ncbi:MAG: DUF1345 domain-containing protein [Xenococcaceae cyanobacterium]